MQRTRPGNKSRNQISKFSSVDFDNGASTYGIGVNDTFSGVGANTKLRTI